MRTLLTTATALTLLATQSVAQTSTQAGNAGAAAGSDQEVRDRAVQNAERAGMQNVVVMDRAFVLEGTTPQGETIWMIVNPPGALIGLGRPVGSGSTAGAGGSAGGAAAGGADAPAAGGYMATQRQPASPEMWDPEGVEERLTELGFSNFTEQKQEGQRMSLRARKDDKDVLLIIDLTSGEIRDDAQQSLGNLGQQ